MISLRKILSHICIVGFIIIICIVLSFVFVDCDIISACSVYIDFAISEYISNTGHFPNSEEDLIRYGVLKKDNSEGKLPYELKIGDNYRHIPFERFIIAYGTDANDIIKINNKLIKRATNKEFYLIKGPYKFFFNSLYRNTSLHWYKIIHEPDVKTESK